jgi:murein DD-endopeptidase MepM/ murein hydrolase activator NlpD
MKKNIIYSLLLALVCSSLLASVANARVHSSDSHVSYSDYPISNYVNLKSPFTNGTGGTDMEYPVNEKFQQPRLWYGGEDTHEGIDLSSPKNTPARAVWKGKVTYVKTGAAVSQTYLVVQLDLDQDGNYTEEKIYAVYEHMLSVSVSVGDIVSAGEEVGRTGYYGSDPNQGVHLHFGLTNNSSSTYTNLVWIPTYNFYKNSSLYNYGKDMDFLYDYRSPDYYGTVYISGYHKPNSGTTRNQLDYVRLYHRAAGTSNAWTGTTMNYNGNFTYSYNLSNLGYNSGQQIEYFFVGRAANSSSYYSKVGYYPPKYYIPSENPNTNNWAYSKYYYRMPGDSFEPNDSISTAKSISKSSNYYPTLHKSTDIDWFRVYHSGGSLRVALQSIPTGTDYDVYLYNSSGAQIGSSLNGGNSNESIYVSVSSGYYYIQVKSWSGYNMYDSYNLYTY